MLINNEKQLVVNRKLKQIFLPNYQFFNIAGFLLVKSKTRNNLDGMKEVLFTEDDYRAALKRFLEICDAEEDTPEAKELDRLMAIMEIYERENCS